MRNEAYRVFEIVAWPAAVAGALQTALLLATTSTGGLAEALLVASCATGTITACRLRRAALAAAGRGEHTLKRAA
ncbi:MAG: hypothetical protein HY875_12195 [Chloroflexi bacterium]|nr:hypothetical protein [Chloroflexota bacterium]